MFKAINDKLFYVKDTCFTEDEYDNILKQRQVEYIKYLKKTRKIKYFDIYKTNDMTHEFILPDDIITIEGKKFYAFELYNL